MRFANKVLLPYPIRYAVTTVKSVKYIWKGLCSVLKGKIEVALLDGVAIGVSVLRGDMETAASVMFLLDIGEPLPVEKKEGGYVYAGTVLEEGELTIQVKVTSGATRYEKIVTMIEETEKLKFG